MGSVWSHWLSVRCTLHLFLVLLPFKKPLQALCYSVAYWRGGGWDTRHWSAQIKVCVLEGWTKSKQPEMILTFVMWTWEHLCIPGRMCGRVCVLWRKEQVSAEANRAATQISAGVSHQDGFKIFNSAATMRNKGLVTFSRFVFITDAGQEWT